jgi:hypothetical protein
MKIPEKMIRVHESTEMAHVVLNIYKTGITVIEVK